MAGRFISFEGPDGSGKSTVIRAVCEHFNEAGRKVYMTREPGGTGSVIAEKIRELILDVDHTAMDARTEALLYAASRRQHVTEIIQPRLAQGEWVLTDRFVDSSYVYQGVARNLPIEAIRSINEFAIEEEMPELTLLIDVPAEIGLERIHQARGERQFDRLDQESLAFHRSVRQAFLDLAENEDRIHVIDGTQPIEDVVNDCLRVIYQFTQPCTKLGGNES